MRILLMPSSYPPVLGGLQTAAHALARELRMQSHATRVLTNRYPRSLKSRETMDGIPISRELLLQPRLQDLRNRRLDLWCASLLYHPANLWRVKRMVSEFCPDVVNVHFPDAQIPLVLSLIRRRRFRLVVSLHGHDILRWSDLPVGPESKGSRRREFISLLQEADCVTACSAYLLERAAKIEPSVSAKGCAIHNGIAPDRFADKTRYSHPKPYVLAFGRLVYQKGFDLLLQAFGRVAADHPGVDLVIAGEGEERDRLRRMAAEMGLGARVLLTGRASPPEVIRLLNGCLFAVVPSRWEPFGITALEALAAGKAVLATRVGGLPEFLGSYPGRTLLVEPTVAALSEGIASWLWRQTDFARSHRMSSAELSAFSWTAAAGKYLNAYGENG